jgi:hypothetical protein
MLNLPIDREKILFQGVYKKSQTHLYAKTSLSYGPRWRLRKIKKDPVSSFPGNFSSITLLMPSKLFLILIGVLQINRQSASEILNIFASSKNRFALGLEFSYPKFL